MSSTTWNESIAQAPTAVKQRNRWAQAWRRYRRNRLALFGLVWVVLVIFAAFFAPYLTPWQYDAIDPSNGLAPPSSEHWMGTDQLGRDLLTRIIYATRPMLLVGLVTNIIGVLIGVPLGIFAAYRGGLADWLITRLIDMFSALPWYLIVLYMVMVLSPSLQNLIIALTITSWVGTARLVRGLTFSIREYDFIEAARALGIPTRRILLHHVLPHAAPLVVWGFASGVPTAVLAEAGLSFIGMGIRPPQPSWGRMLGEAFQYLAYWPHMFIFPATMISLTILAFQGMADGLREAMDVKTNT
jgi:oligopeptide transport system permease protein